MDKVGYWVPEKKRKKLNFETLGKLLKEKGIELVQLDLHRPLVDQGSFSGPFSVILHKLTDVITQASHGDNKSITMLQTLETHLKLFPDVVVLDPLASVKILMDRNRSYQVLQGCLSTNPEIQKVAQVPNFVEIHTTKEAEIRQRLEEANVGFPLVCKHLQAHGSVMSHKMALIFNEAGLKDIKPPCVAQTFINHNALLHKMFVVGDQYFLVKRPSVKNFTIGGSDQSTIFFDSHDVSKPNSTSFLNELDDTDADSIMVEPCSDVLKSLADSLQSGLQMALFGADIIIENHTGIYYVIDVNAFPGYDGVPEFMSVLSNYITKLKELPGSHKNNSIPPTDATHSRDDTHSNGISVRDEQAANHVLNDCPVRESCKQTKRPHCEVIENGADSVELACKKSPVVINGQQNGSVK